MRRRWKMPENMTQDQSEDRKKKILESLNFHQKRFTELQSYISEADKYSPDYIQLKDLYYYHRGMIEILKMGYLYPGELPDDLLRKFFPYIDQSDDLSDYVCFDLETTSKYPDSCDIIEIGAVKVRDGEIIETFSSLVRSPILIPRHITSLTGITIDENIQFPVSSEILPKFVEFIGNYTLIGHNIKTFDYPILKRHCSELGIHITNEIYDTLPLSRELLPDLRSHKLSDLCAYYGIENRSAHRALSDAEANHYIFQNLYYSVPGDPKRIPEKSEDTYDNAQPPVGKNMKQFCDVLYNALYNRMSSETIDETSNWFNEHPTLKNRTPYSEIFKEINNSENNRNDDHFFKLFLNFIKENYYETSRKKKQISHNENTEQWTEVCKKIEEYVKILSDENNIPFDKYVSMKPNKDNSVPIRIESTMIAKLLPNPNIRIAFPVFSFLKFSPDLPYSLEKNPAEYGSVEINPNDLESPAMNLLKTIFINYTPQNKFGCCSRYKKCSDAKRCVHRDLFYAKGCQYKKNLDSGKIFY